MAPQQRAAASAADADARFGDRLARELRGVLGSDIAVTDVIVERGDSVGLRARCLVAERSVDLRGTGATLLDASQDLVRAAAALRLTVAWTRLVEPA